MERPGAQQSSCYRRVTSISTLTLVVVGWWLLLAGAVVWLIPEPTAAATSTPPTAMSGQTARIHQRAARASDRDAFEETFAGSEWLDASHGQLVRIVATDGEVVQVEFLEGPYEGRRAWLQARHLSPPGGGGAGG